MQPQSIAGLAALGAQSSSGSDPRNGTRHHAAQPTVPIDRCAPKIARFLQPRFRFYIAGTERGTPCGNGTAELLRNPALVVPTPRVSPAARLGKVLANSLAMLALLMF